MEVVALVLDSTSRSGNIIDFVLLVPTSWKAGTLALSVSPSQPAEMFSFATLIFNNLGDPYR